VQEKHALCYILTSLRGIIEGAEEGGVLTEKETRVIGDGITERLWKLYYDNPLRKMPTLSTMIDSIPLFVGLSTELREQVLSQSNIILVPKGGKVFAIGDRITQAYIVLHGRIVESNGKGKKYDHEQGGLVGVQYFLMPAAVATTKASAATLTYLQIIPLNLLKTHIDSFELRLWREGSPVVIMFSDTKGKNMPSLHTYALKKIINSSEVSINRHGDVIEMPFGGITLTPISDSEANAEGDQVTSRTNEQQFVLVSLLNPSEGGEGHVAEQMTITVRFREDIYQKWAETGKDIRKALFAYTANERPSSLLINHRTSFGEDEAIQVDVPDSP
jgi:hypothetical protein